MALKSMGGSWSGGKWQPEKGTVQRGIEVSKSQLDSFLSDYAAGKTIKFPQYLSSGVNFAFTAESGAPSTNVTYSIKASGKRGRTVFNL